MYRNAICKQKTNSHGYFYYCVDSHDKYYSILYHSDIYEVPLISTVPTKEYIVSYMNDPNTEIILGIIGDIRKSFIYKSDDQVHILNTSSFRIVESNTQDNIIFIDNL